jgi:xanthine dehydrogenase accessory factor
LKRSLLDEVIAARAARRPVVRLAWLDEGREALVDAAGLERARQGGEIAGIGSLSPELVTALEESVASDRARLVDDQGGPVFVHPFNPPLRLAIVGAVHIAQRLATLTRDLGYEVLVIDPRRGFLTEARFPGVRLDHAWPDDALERFAPDARTAVVTLSHDAKIDEPALGVALRAPCFYVGALGSRRTQERRRERLREAGLPESALERIHGPVGLDLGAKSPAEIALSIAAEMTAVLRGRRSE